MKIVLADNQQLTAAGLSSFLRDRADFEISAHISISDDLIDTVKEVAPDLLIVDYNLNGFVTIQDLEKLTKEKPELNILVLSSDNDNANIMKVLQLGVKGYITKECSRDEVLMAIQSTS